MKVLLMVEREGRVVSVGGSFPEYMWRRGGEKIHEMYRDAAGLGPVRLAWIYGKWAASLLASDRWWLVEAASAEAARCYIKGQHMDDAPGYRAECAAHILAQGGRS